MLETELSGRRKLRTQKRRFLHAVEEDEQIREDLQVDCPSLQQTSMDFLSPRQRWRKSLALVQGNMKLTKCHQRPFPHSWSSLVQIMSWSTCWASWQEQFGYVQRVCSVLLGITFSLHMLRVLTNVRIYGAQQTSFMKINYCIYLCASVFYPLVSAKWLC